MVLKLFTTFIVVAAILASPKHRDFTWSYRSSIYRAHWCTANMRWLINDFKNSSIQISTIEMHFNSYMGLDCCFKLIKGSLS